MAQDVYVGRIRSVVPHVLLGLVTLGIYFFVWYTVLASELHRYRQRGPHPAVLLVVFLLIPVVGWFISAFLAGIQVRRAQLDADADKLSSPWYPALWSLAPVVGWVIAAGMLQTGANAAWTRLHKDWHRATSGPITLECPQCQTRFEQALVPFSPTAVACPQCGRAGAV